MKYYDIREAVTRGYPFNFILGARGIGKTYSSLDYHAIENDIKFIYLRTSEKEIDMNVNKSSNPFKKVNEDKKRNIEVSNGDIKTFIETLDGEAIIKGYAIPLSTFSNIRGVDFSDVRSIIWDEFIRENQQKIKNMAFSFFNLYESVNRNRELIGEEPVRVYFLSNSTTLDSPILEELGLVSVIEMMLRKGQRKWSDPERGIYIHLPYADISEEKKTTALYRLTSGSDFFNFAIKNEFVNNSFHGVERKNIVEYTPLCALDSMYIYRHKSGYNIYISSIRADCISYSRKDSYVLFQKHYGLLLRDWYASEKVIFESYHLKSRFLEIIKWK